MLELALNSHCFLNNLLAFGQIIRKNNVKRLFVQVPLEKYCFPWLVAVDELHGCHQSAVQDVDEMRSMLYMEMEASLVSLSLYIYIYIYIYIYLSSCNFLSFSTVSVVSVLNL